MNSITERTMCKKWKFWERRASQKCKWTDQIEFQREANLGIATLLKLQTEVQNMADLSNKEKNNHCKVADAKNRQK